jgi:hypothetical protein
MATVNLASQKLLPEPSTFSNGKSNNEALSDGMNLRTKGENSLKINPINTLIPVLPGQGKRT